MEQLLRIFFASAVLAAHAAAAPEGDDWMRPSDARIREQGNIQGQGMFSFWTEGRFGDWFVAESAGQISMTVTCGGKTIGEPPRMGVELTSPTDSLPRGSGALPSRDRWVLDTL